MRLNTFKKGFGARVKKYRENLNLTQAELAEKTGVELSTIGKIEIGKNFATAKTILQLSKVFEIHPSQLFDFGIKNKLQMQNDDKIDKILAALYDCNDKQLEYIYKMITCLNEE